MPTASPTAPGHLETVRRFVNTRDIDLALDELSTTDDLLTWLQNASLLDADSAIAPGDLRRAVALREALREALAANHAGTPIPADAMAVIDEAARRADLSLSLVADLGWGARPRAGGVDGALGALLVFVAEAMADGTWRRLKVCMSDSCRWAFYDQSRARSGKWCSMQVCGNRAKQHAWRARLEDAGDVATAQT